MSAFNIDVLSPDETQRIHAASLRVLADVGIEVADEGIRSRLIAAGAKGADGRRLTFPEEMVAESLLKCPCSFELGAADGRKLRVSPEQRLYSSCLVDPFMFDFDDGRRPPQLQDCVKISRLIDAIDTISFPYKMDVNYDDCRADHGVYLSNYAMMTNMAKPYLCGPHNVLEAKIWVEMAQIMAGGPLAENRLLCALVSPTSPLTFDKDYLELVEFLAPAGVALVVLPCPMSGATAPITMAGTVVILNCELLASIVMIQTLHPDTPVVYHAVALPFNMITTQPSLGGPEKILLGVATANMGRFYNLPCGTAGSSTNTVHYDMQNGAESMSQLLMAVSGPASVITGIGSMANGKGTSAEQILFDGECIKLAHYLHRGIRVDEDRLAYDVIARIGPGGNFLADEHTIKYLRTDEHFLTDSFNRTDGDVEASDMYATLHDKAERLIAAHESAVPIAKIQDLQRYLSQRNIDFSLVKALA